MSRGAQPKERSEPEAEQPRPSGTSAVVVRYQAKPERADENQRLIEAVFAELDERRAEGVHLQGVPARRRRELRARRDRARRRGRTRLAPGRAGVPGGSPPTSPTGATCRRSRWAPRSSATTADSPVLPSPALLLRGEERRGREAHLVLRPLCEHHVAGRVRRLQRLVPAAVDADLVAGLHRDRVDGLVVELPVEVPASGCPAGSSGRVVPGLSVIRNALPVWCMCPSTSMMSAFWRTG